MPIWAAVTGISCPFETKEPVVALKLVCPFQTRNPPSRVLVCGVVASGNTGGFALGSQAPV